MKAHIRRWVNEKHDVITAEDMKTALESHGGVKGTRTAVVEVRYQGSASLTTFPLKRTDYAVGEHLTLELVNYYRTMS